VRAVRRAWPLLSAGLLAFGPAAAAEQAPEEGARIAVAPFERVAAAGVGVPDIAGRLAQRLSTKGVERIVGPEDVRGVATADPPAEDIVALAGRVGVDLVVVGRTTRLGEALSVDARIRTAGTGGFLGSPLVVEVNEPKDLGSAIDELAELVLETSRRDRDTATPGRAARSPRGEAEPHLASGQKQDEGSSEKSIFRSDAPISIKSDELEALDRDGIKKFIFTGRVHAIQADLELDSDRLEAFYPKGESQPDRLVATGHVVMTQTGRRALCEKATFYREEQKVVCVGDAQLEQECDRVRGTEIVFHLDTEVLNVNGAADVRIHPEGVGCKSAVSAGSTDR
jgi:lipopolysaccharide transport protein LptA